MFDKSKLPDLAAREAAFTLHQAYETANDAYYAAVDDEGVSVEEVERIDKVKDAAWEAYAAHPLKVATDADDRAVRCVVSKVPLLSADEMLVDVATDEHVLRAAVGMGPRKGGGRMSLGAITKSLGVVSAFVLLLAVVLVSVGG